MKTTSRVLWSTAVAAAFVLASGAAAMAAEKAAAAKPMHSARAAATVELPAPVKSAFETSYPGATIKHVAKESGKGGVRYEVESMEGTMARDLLYQPDGTVVEVQETMAQSDLPQPVQQAITTKYASGKIVKTEKVTRGTTTLYQVSVLADGKKHMLRVNPDGTLMTPKKTMVRATPNK